MLAAAVAWRLGRPLLFVTAHLEQADDARDDIETAIDMPVALLPAWETLPGEGAAAGEITAERARICTALRAYSERRSSEVSRGKAASAESPGPFGDDGGFAAVAPIHAMIQPVPQPAALDASTLHLAVGDAREPEEIVAFLVERGMMRLDLVESPGDFALRGGILDIFASGEVDPVRIEFFGNEIESIRRFELGMQRSMRTLEQVRVTLPPDPNRTRPKDTTSFLHYLPRDCLVCIGEPLDVTETGQVLFERLGRPVGHYPVEAIHRGLAKFCQLYMSRFPVASVATDQTVTVACESLPEFEPRATDAVQQLVHLARKRRAIVFCDNTGEQERLAELIAEVRAVEPGGGAAPADVDSRIGYVHRGFVWKGADKAGRFAVVPNHELFRRYTQRRRLRKVAATRPIDTFLDLHEGDYVVHVVHGIARFVGMKTMRKGSTGQSEEYLTLRFADNAALHVPSSQIDLVQKYVGAKGLRPNLSKLGGSRWKKTKEKVEAAVGDLAADLLRVQAVRAAQEGAAYPNDTQWQKEFEGAFLYTETPDQLTALGEIKQDLSRPRPMDRLLCGDVGYGKTELAMRAAFKVLEFGRQVAVLVPTTVLAEQHYHTFRERMAEYPFVVERLTRFRSAREQREILKAASKGQIDVLIGTHRLLSNDVQFSDIGLVIIDEEQRFGVEHKERLKQLRATVEILTLTATPIPRTLHMSMIGLRDISSLATPPLDRRAITTCVCPWSEDLIREAVIREMNRDGQVFFVHNRVHSIDDVAARLMTLVPEARILVGHGQMPGDQLEDVMLRFIRHEADILLCTTIIEAGLDIPNANTMLIDRADRFGLADLHQLRGRVGRYKHKAYCYLLLSPDRPLTSTAAKRLKAIEEYSELGAGFRIAMRDLEIRGAGNLLGPQQSGHIAAVGYELYCQLLERTVRRMRGEKGTERPVTHLEFDVEAYIPKGYIQSDRQRMECYRRAAACRTPAAVDQLAQDLCDAYGAYPDPVDMLLSLADIRVRASGWGIQSIIRKEPDVVFNIEGELKKLEPLFAGASGSMRVADARTIHWRLPDHYFHGVTLIRVLRNLFRRRETHVEDTAGGSMAANLEAESAIAAAPVGQSSESPAGARKSAVRPLRATANQLPADAPPRKRRRRRGSQRTP